MKTCDLKFPTKLFSILLTTLWREKDFSAPDQSKRNAQKMCQLQNVEEEEEKEEDKRFHTCARHFSMSTLFPRPDFIFPAKKIRNYSNEKNDTVLSPVLQCDDFFLSFLLSYICGRNKRTEKIHSRQLSFSIRPMPRIRFFYFWKKMEHFCDEWCLALWK